MENADPTDAAQPDGASARSAWIIVAVLAVALVVFAHAVSGRVSPERREPARPSLSDPTTIPTAPKPVDVQTTGPPGKPASTVIVRPATASLVHTLVSAWRDEAKTFCASPSTTPRQGLAKYAMAEDYVRKAIEDAKQSKNKADEDAYTAIYRDLLDESDAYSNRVITPDFIESISWEDLLADGSKWSKVTNVPGFSCRFENGTPTVTPPDAAGKLQGVIGILDQPGDDLRHFVLDMDFAVDGCATMYFHVTPPPGSPNALQSETCDLLASATCLKAGATYNLRASYIGSEFVAPISGNDESYTYCGRKSSWTKRRRGGIAFLIPPGTHLTITRMRIKDLR